MPCRSLLTVSQQEKSDILLGVAQGSDDQLLTPAYWKWRCAIGEAEGQDYVSRSSSLREEIGFCLLGGFGIKMEINDAFFTHLKSDGVFEGGYVTAETIRDLLEQRIEVGGRLQKYRFPRQRAQRISSAMAMLEVDTLSAMSDIEFRNAICELPGVGPKTASWITRNWRGAETVAIIDIHIMRACRYLGIFDQTAKLPRDYFELEKRFLAFAIAIDARPSVLDAVMWSDMRIFGSKLVNRAIAN